MRQQLAVAEKRSPRRVRQSSRRRTGATRRSVPVLDPKVLRELQEIMEEDYLSLLRTYLRNAPQLLDEARQALARSDTASMVIPVHSLKSSSANVGAMQVSGLAREAEQHARAGDAAARRACFRRWRLPSIVPKRRYTNTWKDVRSPERRHGASANPARSRVSLWHGVGWLTAPPRRSRPGASVRRAAG